MAERTKGGNRRFISEDGPDFYPTPPWAIHALCAQEKFIGIIHEPCCGDGVMAKTLERHGYDVVATDLYDHGYGVTGIDAITYKLRVDNIITNPPFNIAVKLMMNFFSRFNNKIALLLRLSFVESQQRYPIFSAMPPARIYVFSERLSMAPRGMEVKGGGTVTYAWFIWEKGHTGETVLKWIPPGFKDRN